MVAATRETLAVLNDGCRRTLQYIRDSRGDFFLRSALEVTPPTLDALLAGEPLDDALVRRIERWCEERVERVYR
jgi:hypothetical protein